MEGQVCVNHTAEELLSAVGESNGQGKGPPHNFVHSHNHSEVSYKLKNWKKKLGTNSQKKL